MQRIRSTGPTVAIGRGGVMWLKHGIVGKGECSALILVLVTKVCAWLPWVQDELFKDQCMYAQYKCYYR